MPRLSHVARALATQPGYTLMRGVARFASVRSLVADARRRMHVQRLRAYLAACEARMGESLFPGVDLAAFVRRLSEDGVAFGLTLPAPMVAEICRYAAQQPCHADRDLAHGFRVAERGLAEAHLSKPILLAQYFNAASQCPTIGQLLCDPALQWIAGKYLESVPTFVGANLWWTFPVDPLEADRDRHAHLFHRDVDDFRFFKFFFYLTDVEPGDGAHVCVVASHRQPPRQRPGDRWNIRRYGDDEIARSFPAEQFVEICGPAGTGFAENTLCVHRALTPTREPRLLLQLQYALFDYGVMHDRRNAAALRLIAASGEG